MLLLDVSKRRCRINLREQCCHNPSCWAYGRQGEGHVAIHSRRERRYRCKWCHRIFAAAKRT